MLRSCHKPGFPACPLIRRPRTLPCTPRALIKGSGENGRPSRPLTFMDNVPTFEEFSASDEGWAGDMFEPEKSMTAGPDFVPQGGTRLTNVCYCSYVSAEGDTPEEALYRHREKYNGSVLIYTSARKASNPSERTNYGTATLLTPVIKDDDGTPHFSLITAAHCADPELQTRFGAAVDHPGYLWMGKTGLAEKPSFVRFLDDISSQEFEALTKPFAHTICVPPMPVTAAYPAIEAEVEQAISNSPDLTASTQHPEVGLDGAVFPYGLEFGCVAGLAPDFVVPTCESPALGSFVSLLGMPAKMRKVDSLYQQTWEPGLDFAAANDEAQLGMSECLPPFRSLATAGDVVYNDGLYIGHRASAAPGMAGGGLRQIDRPKALLGIHIEGGAVCNIAVSVSHPAFIALYMDQALPSLISCREWPEPWMPAVLAAWLRSSQQIIQELDVRRGRRDWATAERFLATQRSFGLI
ncbi:hypothetical protein WJX73_001569 [Symbiochloris irregularis]|uniref:Uncharacterized protein n=1 Tax=Symbiochloris irregularis TaxID=706552 RepID=A0AAW1NGW3_9CHLO